MSASILVVEKSRFVRHILREVLEEAGYRVSAVATTSFARFLVTSDAEQFDLVLLYVRTPNSENVELCNKLRADGFDRPIVILTENAAETRETSQAEASAWIERPFTVRGLLRQIETTLNQYRSKPAPVLHRPRFHSAARR